MFEVLSYQVEKCYASKVLFSFSFFVKVMRIFLSFLFFFNSLSQQIYFFPQEIKHAQLLDKEMRKYARACSLKTLHVLSFMKRTKIQIIISPLVKITIELYIKT